MQPQILDGKVLAQKVQAAVKSVVDALVAKVGRPPGLAVILVGDNEASKAYVANKEKSAAGAGMRTFNAKLPASATAVQVSSVINDFNKNPEVDGILLQLPLPVHLDPDPLLDLIDPGKDIDGLHPHNQGLLAKNRALLKPCTPLGCMMLVDLALAGADPARPEFDPSKLVQADLSGKRAVVIGRSILVGKPAALMLLERNATVVMAHSKTPDLAATAASADILIAAAGKHELVRGDWVKPGAVVIDVGINRVASGKLAGDVAFEEARVKAMAITPVPGGVGPMTIAMLIRNTLFSYQRHTV